MSVIKHLVVPVDGDVLGPAQAGQGRGTVVARESGLAGARDGADPARGIDDAEGMSAALADIEVAARVHGHRARVHEGLGERDAAVLWYALGPVAGDGGDDPGRKVHGADPAVVEVAHVEDAPPEREREDAAELRIQRRPAVTTEALQPGARDARDHTRAEVDLPHAVVEGVGDVKRSVGPQGQMVRSVKAGSGRGTTIAGEAFFAGAREHPQSARLVEHADPVARHLDDVHVAGGVEVDSERLLQPFAHHE